MQKSSFTAYNGKPLLLEGVKARGRVVGRMLDMNLEQRFCNTESTNVEVIYTFPLPLQAVLVGLEIEINGETLKGLVQPKTQAREHYEEALSEGNTAILLTVNSNRSYSLELGNLMQGEVCLVRMHYVQVLRPEQGSQRLTLPTTLAPCYGNPFRDGGLEPHAVPETSTLLEYPFDIRIDIEGEMVHANIGSPSHRIAIRAIPVQGKKERFITQVQLGAQAWLDRDFVLVFDQLNHSSQGLAAWDRLEKNTGVVMASFTPALPTSQSKPVTMKVLVDCSGSMNGDSIRAARSALQAIVTSLKYGDRFSLSRFGSEVEHRCKALWSVAPPSLAAAQRWVQKLEADLGGTNMNDAILSTLALPGAARCDMLLVTDGATVAIDVIVKTARESRHRFFIVAIGSSVAEVLLRRLAEVTGGSCEFVAPGEQVQAAIERHYKRMRSTVVVQARVEWPNNCPIYTETELPISIFDGDDTTVFAQIQSQKAETLTGTVRLLGHLEGDQVEICLAELKPSFIDDEANTLARLAAYQRYWQIK